MNRTNLTQKSELSKPMLSAPPRPMMILVKEYDLDKEGLYISYTAKGEDHTIEATPLEAAQLLLDAKLIQDYNSYAGILYLSPLGIETTPDECGNPLDRYFNPEWTWNEFVSMFNFSITDAMMLAKCDVQKSEISEIEKTWKDDILSLPKMMHHFKPSA
jgi:hypothetical protein